MVWAELGKINRFQGLPLADRIPGQPDFAIGSLAKRWIEQFVVGSVRQLRGTCLGERIYYKRLSDRFRSWTKLGRQRKGQSGRQLPADNHQPGKPKIGE